MLRWNVACAVWRRLVTWAWSSAVDSSVDDVEEKDEDEAESWVMRVMKCESMFARSSARRADIQERK